MTIWGSNAGCPFGGPVWSKLLHHRWDPCFGVARLYVRSFDHMHMESDQELFKAGLFSLTGPWKKNRQPRAPVERTSVGIQGTK